MSISEKINFMELALKQAEISLKEGNFPVGAVLVINGKFVDQARNLLSTNSDWISHAEMNLIIKHSSLIRESRMENIPVEIYTTLEPCLMCLGSSVLHRISKIIYACPDKFTGAFGLRIQQLPERYAEIYPTIEEAGVFKKESQKLVLEYMGRRQTPKWKTASQLMEDIE